MKHTKITPNYLRDDCQTKQKTIKKDYFFKHTKTFKCDKNNKGPARKAR